jgi:hypothetical protein
MTGNGKKYTTKNVPTWALKSRQSFMDYADYVGAKHMWYETPTVFGPSPFYESLRAVYDESLDVYDTILFVDCDVLSRSKDNIFEYDVKHVGGVMDRHITELPQDLIEYIAKKNQTFKDGWFNYETEAHDAIREHYGWLKWNKSTTYPFLDQFINSGVVLWTPSGREKARQTFEDMHDYYSIKFGLTNGHKFQKEDQCYLNVQCVLNKIHVTELPVKFNDQEWDKHPNDKSNDSFIHFTGDKGKDRLNQY